MEVSKRYTTDSRFYRIKRGNDESYYPSVTTILGTVKVAGFLDNWKEEMAEKIGVLGRRIQLFLDAERGTTVHHAIEEYNRMQMAGKQATSVPMEWGDFTDEEWSCLLRYHQWFQERKPKVISTEHTLYSDEHRYAGQADAIMEIDGKTYIVDFKTSKQISDDYYLQCAAYQHAYEEMTGASLHGFLILALRVETKKGWREGMVETEMPPNRKGERERNVADYFEGFLRRKACFDWERPDFQPRRSLLPDRIDPFES